MNSHKPAGFAQEPADLWVAGLACLAGADADAQCNDTVSGLSRPGTCNSKAVRQIAGTRPRHQRVATPNRRARLNLVRCATRRSKRLSFRYPSLGGWPGFVQCQTTRLFSFHCKKTLPFPADRIVLRDLRQPPVIAAGLCARQEPEGTPPCSKRS